jgi:hypothetical protein
MGTLLPRLSQLPHPERTFHPARVPKSDVPCPDDASAFDVARGTLSVGEILDAFDYPTPIADEFEPLAIWGDVAPDCELWLTEMPPTPLQSQLH